MTTTLSVEVGDGTFVYTGIHPDGSANWRFLRKKDGVMRPAPVPKHLQRMLRKIRRTK